jgi:hypothetical protein
MRSIAAVAQQQSASTETVSGSAAHMLSMPHGHCAPLSGYC